MRRKLEGGTFAMQLSLGFGLQNHVFGSMIETVGDLFSYPRNICSLVLVVFKVLVS